jgi:cytochrome b6-f complex iron-sulfur subunit
MREVSMSSEGKKIPDNANDSSEQPKADGAAGSKTAGTSAKADAGQEHTKADTTPANADSGKERTRADTTPVKADARKERTKPEKVTERASIGEIEEPIKRRTFFSWMGIAWLAFAGATAAFLTMLARFMFPNVLFEPAQTFKAGFPDEYPVGEVDLRWKDRYGVWIVRTNEYIYALSTTCTHLGCTPNWLPSDRKFKCPCHGSGFKISGINFEGPAPRPLERLRVILADDGQILIDKTKKYQQEKGHWNDPESFLVV